MEALKRAARMEHIHSDIRGPLYLKALEMQKNGEKSAEAEHRKSGSIRIRTSGQHPESHGRERR